MAKGMYMFMLSFLYFTSQVLLELHQEAMYVALAVYM